MRVFAAAAAAFIAMTPAGASESTFLAGELAHIPGVTPEQAADFAERVKTAGVLRACGLPTATTLEPMNAVLDQRPRSAHPIRALYDQFPNVAAGAYQIGVAEGLELAFQAGLDKEQFCSAVVPAAR
jgi:hypothetical protein